MEFCLRAGAGGHAAGAPLVPFCISRCLVHPHSPSCAFAHQVLVDTPLAPYFSDNLTSEDLDEMNIEVRAGLVHLAAAVLFSAWRVRRRPCAPLCASIAIRQLSCFKRNPLTRLTRAKCQPVLSCCVHGCPAIHPQVMRNTLYKAPLCQVPASV